MYYVNQLSRRTVVRIPGCLMNPIQSDLFLSCGYVLMKKGQYFLFIVSEVW